MKYKIIGLLVLRIKSYFNTMLELLLEIRLRVKEKREIESKNKISVVWTSNLLPQWKVLSNLKGNANRIMIILFALRVYWPTINSSISYHNISNNMCGYIDLE
jgi:hypothetical protein